MKQNNKNVFTLKLLLVLAKACILVYYLILSESMYDVVKKKAEMIHFPFNYANISMTLVYIL